jgi:hypothetical protein
MSMLESAKQERAAALTLTLLASKDAEIAASKAAFEVCRRNVILQRFLLRAIQSKLASGFRTWKLNVADIVRHENFEKKVSIYMKNRLSAKAFHSWATVSLSGADSDVLCTSDLNDINEVNTAYDILSKKLKNSKDARPPKEFEIVTLADVAALRELLTHDALPIWNKVKVHLRTALIFGIDHNMSVMIQNSNGSSEMLSSSWTTRPIIFNGTVIEETKEGADLIQSKAPQSGFGLIDSSKFHSAGSTTAPSSSSSALSLIAHGAQAHARSDSTLPGKQSDFAKAAVPDQFVQVSEVLASQLHASRAALQKVSGISTGSEADVTVNTDLVGKRFEAILTVANARISDLLKREYNRNR